MATKQRRVNFSSWGVRGLRIPAYARMTAADYDSITAVARAIGAANGGYAAGCSEQGTRLNDRGDPIAHDYQITVCRSGGHVIGSVWVSLPINREQ